MWKCGKSQTDVVGAQKMLFEPQWLKVILNSSWNNFFDKIYSIKRETKLDGRNRALCRYVVGKERKILISDMTLKLCKREGLRDGAAWNHSSELFPLLRWSPGLPSTSSSYLALHDFVMPRSSRKCSFHSYIGLTKYWHFPIQYKNESR